MPAAKKNEQQTDGSANSAPGIKVIPIESVTPYARNSRTHDDAQVAEIAASVEAFGMVGAIIVRDGIIAKGHGTLCAIQRLYKGGKLIYPAPGKPGGAQPYPPGTVPVLDVSGWSEAQFRAYVIADNRLAEKAGWDNAMLALEFGDLREMDFDLQLTGFEIGDIDDLLGLSQGPGDGEGNKRDLETLNAGGDKSRSGVSVDAVKFGNNEVNVTKEEIESMEVLLKRYVEEFGLTYGFFAWLCEGREDA